MADPDTQAAYDAAYDGLGTSGVTAAAAAGGVSRRMLELKRRGERSVRAYDVWALTHFAERGADASRPPDGGPESAAR